MLRPAFVAASTLCLALAFTQPSPAQEWARKMFEVTSHDFGTIARGAKAEFAFDLRNLYLEDVHIASVRTNCGCTTPRIEGDTLKTYEKGAIVARINSQSFLGHQRATITVTFDKPMRAQVQLHVKVYVYSNVLLEPAGVNFGTVPLGSNTAQTIGVRYTGQGDWRILDVRSHNPNLTGTLVERQRAGDRVIYDLQVALDGDAPAGYLKDQLWLITNDVRAEHIPVPVEGHVLPAIAVSPSSLFLGAVPPGQSVTRQIVVRGQKPFRIANVHAECGCLNATLSADKEPKALHLVAMTFTPGEKTGKISQTVVIETDSGQRLELPTHAVVGDGR